MPEASLGLLRIRVINRSPQMYFTDGFEAAGGMAASPGSANITGTTFWHSLGTEAGTDNSISYWTTLAGAPTYASHVLTVPSGAIIKGGHSDWTDCIVTVRVKWVTSSFPKVLIHCVDANNFIACGIDGGFLYLQKNIAGTTTNVATIASSPINGTTYFLVLQASGTTYTSNLYLDSGSGVIGAVSATVSGTISDSAVASGAMGLTDGLTAAAAFGGAMSNVCTVTGTSAGGATQDWTPSVTTGEPAFAISKVNPQAGTFSASVQINGSSSGNGAWTQATRLLSGTTVALSGQAKATAGTANVSAGGLTTGNAGSSFGAVTASGAMTANPTVSCNYSGAIGTAYFDSLAITNYAYEITNDLPHLHGAVWTVAAMQPGNPGSTALGSFTIPLHPPGSDAYAVAKPIYDSLTRYQRVEAYISQDGASLGKLAFAGVITGIRKNYGPTASYELIGASDVQLANMSRPFPGELLSNDVTSAMLKSYLGANELGASDTFNPFTAGNYTSTNAPGLASGTWSGTTDDGFNVATVSTGTGAVLISKTGASAADRWHTQFVEVTGRLNPLGNAKFGIGLSKSNANLNDCLFVYAAPGLVNGRYVVNVAMLTYSAGVNAVNQTISNALLNADDPQAMVPLTVGMLATNGGNSAGTPMFLAIVNGRMVMSLPSGWDLGTTTWYPFLYFGTSGSGVAYMTNLVQMTRFTTDGASSAAAFGNGTISTSSVSLGYGVDPGPTFLEAWTRLATRNGWYWRYTPQAYTTGTRTLGTVDFAADPGTDRTASVIFRRDQGNLVSLEFNNNGDPLAADTALSGQSTPDGGGIGYWRDVGTLGTYGVIQDEALSFTHSDFNSLRRAAFQVNKNKINLDTLGAKTAIVLRDPQFADTYRELDKITIHDPEMGLNYASVRIMARTFTEGQPTETLLLDQFSEDFIP